MMRLSRLLVLTSLFVGLLSGIGPAAEQATWLRYPAISPDGKQLVFSYRGDLWVVPTSGGTARLLTSHEGYESSPVWSPDGERIAFASDRNGNFDVYLIQATGGESRRLTYHSASDIPNSFTPDGKSVLFSSRRLDAPEAVIGSGAMGELYAVSLVGGRPRQVLTTEAEHASTQPGGSLLLFQDYKGFENRWRKHHTSSVTRDIWVFDPENNKHRRVSDYEGEDRDPVWSPDGRSFFYLSERTGTLNIWRSSLEDVHSVSQVTHHKTHPVRFLSIANDGTLAYGFNGELWLKPTDQDARRIDVEVVIDDRANTVVSTVERSGATEMAVSPSEKEVAFVVRGEVFVTSVEYGTTKRITNTSEQERSITWSKDGRTLYYAGERDGSWNLYQTRITRDDESSFTYATLLTEEPLLVSNDETFQPLISPDGKQIAYLRNREEIRVLDLETKQSSVLVPAKKNFSYTDGDIEFAWSPDSKWLTFTYMGHASWTQEIGLVNIATGELTNISESGYSESHPRFASNREVLLYITDRYGERSHGSWGSEDDVFGLYLTQEAYDRATLSEEELELAKQREEDSKKDKDSESADDQDKPKASEDDDKEPTDKPMQIDLQDREHRIRRLTLHSALISSFDLSPDGETLIYMAQVEDTNDLWISKVREQTTYKAYSTSSSAAGEIRFAKDGKSAFLLQSGRITKLDLAGALSPGGKASPKPVSFAAQMTIDGPAERAYLFEHAWRQTKEKFYDPKMHGVDWQAMKENYERFLPSINNNHDFAELLSELLGELNASHTGSGYRLRKEHGDSTAAFGVLYDVKYDGVGLKVGAIIERGPLDDPDTKVKLGTIITHIDGVRLTPDVNPWPLLNHKEDVPVRLSLLNPDTNEEWEEVVTPISQREETALRYEGWIASRRELCEKLSNGRVGYVHVEGMDDASFRRVYSDVLGRNNEKEALIVDTRFNGGGWLHDHLVTFLSGEQYIFFVPRGKEIGDLGGEPIGKWTKPVAVLQSESNYSDAHFFPWAFKELNIGPLVGAPVPGTATAVWWETLIDPTLYFGIPQVGMKTREGKYLENEQLEPDYLVINDPESMAKGEDKQLEKAVDVMLKTLDAQQD